ncbi:hypothetical protein [Lentibacillus sp. CBA3610]|uniref:hypothetical protein n=1 Tax=Lentibacillus sp. CBA3610 TaxID=2518176 RepID=UPI0015954336|nr:hypothetical protein [Lentibacillus sp. CBA3610]QKY69702.1 hypothetical protein Len3610_08915 [Lentibacillus sp. CBA3610]
MAKKKHNPEHQRKRQEKVDNVKAKNQAKQSRLMANIKISRTSVSIVNMNFAEAKTVHGMDRC